MITAQHKAWAHRVFYPYLKWLCKRRFHAVELLGDLPKIPDGMPILLLPNHSTWWDGFFPYLLNKAIFKRTYYIMMLEHRLREFWFFRLLGAFSINQQSPKGIIESLSYASSILTSTTKGATPLVVMFPQGELRPSGVRPLGYNRGVERIMAKSRQQSSPLAIVPLAMRCEFLSEERPFVFLECGTPHILLPGEKNADNGSGNPDMVLTAQILEQETEVLLERLEQRILAAERGLKIV
jgi:1-acyl-sn-glycerol-3-phosphate acyltransferase